jgi:nifR3 family TIM-barrel protein
MNKGFWTQLKRPVMVLAPMVGVTDAAFRRIIAKYGKPDVMWTEFVSADGLCSRGREALLHDLWFDDSERPILAQIYSGKPAAMRESAAFCKELGFDGIDINMGCPDKTVERHGAGAALIRRPGVARELIEATIEGAGGLPVSVKTRIGYHENEIEEWLATLLGARPAAITLHARTRDEMSRVPARLDVIARAVELARELIPDEAERPLILHNGDVKDLAEAGAVEAETGCDGVMIGRGIFGNPWLFNRHVERKDLSIEQVIDVMLEHSELYVELFGHLKHFDPLKKHYKAYVTGFRGAAAVRDRFMLARDIDEVRELSKLAVALAAQSE